MTELYPEDVIEFLEQDLFKARKIIVVAKRYIDVKGGAAHKRNRKIAHDGYCYEEISVKPIQ